MRLIKADEVLDVIQSMIVLWIAWDLWPLVTAETVRGNGLVVGILATGWIFALGGFAIIIITVAIRLYRRRP